MMVGYDELIELLVLVATGLCGFGLGGLSNCNNKALRSVAWFIPGLVVGAVIMAIFIAFTTPY